MVTTTTRTIYTMMGVKALQDAREHDELPALPMTTIIEDPEE